MSVGPVSSAFIVPTEPEQTCLQPQLGVLERELGGIARPTEVADRFVVDGRHAEPRSRTSGCTRRPRRLGLRSGRG
jgi:hypothetical protein